MHYLARLHMSCQDQGKMEMRPVFRSISSGTRVLIAFQDNTPEMWSIKTSSSGRFITTLVRQFNGAPASVTWNANFSRILRGL